MSKEKDIEAKKESRETKAEEKEASEKEEKPKEKTEKKDKEAGEVKEDSAKEEKEDSQAGEGEKEAAEGEEAPAEEGDEKRFSEPEIVWVPKTKLGNEVLAGKFKSLEEVLQKGELILEPEIVDFLVPEIEQEIVYIGGSPGKGGGIRRTATKMTARMHKSGRRFKLTALAVVGNLDGILGIGKAISNEHRTAIEKATKNAKLSVIRVKRGCGSWECGCGAGHSIPFTVSGRSGSVQATLLPAPKGVGMVASEETKKVLKLAGISDVWVKTKGKTSTRTNLVMAVFDALKTLNSRKGDL